MQTAPALALASDVGRKQRSETGPPQPNRLVAHIYATFEQQILDIPQTQREPEVEHHHEPDYLR